MRGRREAGTDDCLGAHPAPATAYTGGWVRMCHGVRPWLRSWPQDALAARLERERDRWFLWVPVFVGLGIAGYFWLPFEPGWALALAPLVAAGGLRLAVRRGTWALVASGALLAAATGFALAKLRTEIVRAPVIAKKTGPITLTGWVEWVTPGGARGPRLTIRVIAIEGFGEADRPVRVRIRSRFRGQQLSPGMAVRVRAILRPPPEPAMPGGYDFAREAWFRALGGVGFAIAKPEPFSAAAAPPFDLVLKAWVERLRHRIALRITSQLPGPEGALAAALITGERGAIPEEVVEALRRAGLAHILAISGLHMAIMAGAIYWLARSLLALSPALALRYRVKTWAALLGLFGAGVYLVISGASVATERAYVMVALMFLAAMLGRPAVSLRNVALAALAILLLRPESLFSVSFQMSFAAVTALVAVYEALAKRAQAREPHLREQRSRDEGARDVAARVSVGPGAARRVAYFFLGIVFTTLVASLAVAPFAAYHFHKLTQYGVLANLLAVPLFSVVVMPLALVSLLAMPLGLDGMPLAAMGRALDGILWVAQEVAGRAGAVRHVAQMPASALGLFVLGGLWLALWQTRWRLAGLVFVALGLVLAPQAPRPDLLISRNAKTVAIRLGDGRLSFMPGRGGGYEMRRWLEADGAPANSAGPLRGRGYRCDRRGCVARVRGKRLALPKMPAALEDDCREAQILVLAFSQARACPSAELVIDGRDLARSGAHAVTIGAAGAYLVETVAERRGRRPWVRARGQAPYSSATPNNAMRPRVRPRGQGAKRAKASATTAATGSAPAGPSTSRPSTSQSSRGASDSRSRLGSARHQ